MAATTVNPVNDPCSANACFLPAHWIRERVASRSLRKVGAEMGVTAPAVLAWKRGAPMPRWAVVICELLAERDAHQARELSAGLPDGACDALQPRGATAAPLPTPKPVRAVRRRRRPAPAT